MAAALTLFQITDNVHFARGSAVNWVLVTDDTGVMLIDAGYPGDRQDVLESLRQVGYGPADVHAILLTHAHVDHLGSAIWFANEHGTPVYCHAEEVGHAKREYLEQASVVDVALRIWRPRWAVWTAHLIRNGGLVREGIPTTKALTAEVAAELPGYPMPVFTPGHTNGHCSYLVDGVLVSGDALITGHPLPAATAGSVQPQPTGLPAQPGRPGPAGNRDPAAGPRRCVARTDPRGHRRGHRAGTLRPRYLLSNTWPVKRIFTRPPNAFTTTGTTLSATTTSTRCFRSTLPCQLRPPWRVRLCR
jgi:glyoxylase-like metal-dependent hydrolase (beta-lactamase superfamily II)